MFLVALYPPSNIAREVSRFLDVLFRRYGLTDGRVLPPHISLGFFSTRPEIPNNDAPNQPAILSLAGITTVERAAFLSVKPQSALRAIAGWTADPPIEPLYATGFGFLLARDAPADHLNDFEREAAKLDLKWSTSILRCHQLHIKNTQAWWEYCYFEEIWSKKVRRFLQH